MSKRLQYAYVIVIIVQAIIILYIKCSCNGSRGLLQSLYGVTRDADMSSDSGATKAVVEWMRYLLFADDSIAVKRSLAGHLNELARLLDPWHEMPDKFDRLHENMIYEGFRIEPPLEREKVDLILIVSSAPKRSDRRSGIRDTWWSSCKSNKRITVKCIFLTDHVDPDLSLGRSLLRERKLHRDLHFQYLEGGSEFGKRFLVHLVYALARYDFKYFVRVDDDYFLCLDKFLAEIPMPPRSLYHWGFVHCVPDIVRMEESIVLLSRDLVQIFLGQDPNKMMCHKYADQMVAIWNQELNLGPLYRHDFRLHHDPPASYSSVFVNDTSICGHYIGLHGTYPAEMRKFWSRRGGMKLRPLSGNSSLSFDDYTYKCSLPNVFNWTLFDGVWREEPKLCKMNPRWEGVTGDTYTGRQGS